jgi:hypothetical protein
MRLLMVAVIVGLLVRVLELSTDNAHLKERLQLTEVPPPVQTTSEVCVAWLFSADLQTAKRRLCGGKRH